MVEKIVKAGKKKKKKMVFDIGFIASEYYYGIILAVEVVLSCIEKVPNVLIVGLGGGCVTSFLANKYKSRLYMNSIEIDPEVIQIAKKYFNFKVAIFIKALF